MPRIDVSALPIHRGSGYPAPFHEPCTGRSRQRLGDAAGLTQFGVNLLRLAPGAWSSQRHWHVRDDEFVFVVEGEVVLVEDAGETVLRAGDCAGWKAKAPDGHHLRNRTDRDALVLEIGSRNSDEKATYPDIDMIYEDGRGYLRKDGTPYPKRSA
jgi:uncharacterized cupin superfamily protein